MVPCISKYEACSSKITGIIASAFMNCYGAILII
jgi:hypothetical protein